MILDEILNSKDRKVIEKRKEIVEGIKEKTIDIDQICQLDSVLDYKKRTVILEAMEEITRGIPEISTREWLKFAEQYIDAEENGLKREASRVVGNIAHLYEGILETSIKKLLLNAENEGTVVRWGSAYALSKIIVIPRYAGSNLFAQLREICNCETEKGVKNLYSKSLKKAEKSLA